MALEPSEQQWKITRSFARFAMEVPVSAMMSESASIPVASGKMRDISLGGMAAFLDPPVAVGQRLWLEFLLPQATSPMRLLCKVRHDYGERFGFQFLNISPEQQEQIRQSCVGLVNV
ncbi:MAG TPA: PilZ domain-containing protein [Terriglobales bacterium]|nr:PilZ domain-containing protein [Terriglobales bacterium]